SAAPFSALISSTASASAASSSAPGWRSRARSTPSCCSSPTTPGARTICTRNLTSTRTERPLPRLSSPRPTQPMSVQTLSFIIVGLSFALYLYIAWRSRAGTTSEFFVSGTSVHPVHNGMATAADWMSAASFISMAGIISFMGRDGGVYLMGWTGGYVLLALLLAPYLRKFGKFTVPDFVGDRYYSHSARIVAVLCAIMVSFTYVAGQMQGVGIVFSRFLEVPLER